LADRDAENQEAYERKTTCETIAKNQFPLESILSLGNVEDLEKLFIEISSIQTIHHNQTISIDHKVGAEFEEQTASARIHLIKFFIIKAICCKLEGIELNYNNKVVFLVSDTSIRLKHLEMEISNLLREAFAICADDDDTMRAFQERILSRTLQAEEAVSLPSSPPELFVDREDKSERAPDFIRRVYAPWLGKGLLRPHIKELDKSLYQSLYKHGVPEDFDELLPKASGKSAKKGGILNDLEAIAKVRSSWRNASKKSYKGVKPPKG
jgi:hypothetical protein